MKRNFLSLAFSIGFIFFSDQSFAELEKFKIDPQHSFVVWRINHLGFSEQTGKWPVNGTIFLDQQHPEKGKVDAVIHINDMVTGIPELNKHLEGDLFFNTKKFPEATFVSDKIIQTSKETATVDGKLTLHGVVKPISLKTTLNKIGSNPINDKPSVGLSATTELNRSDFDVKGFLPMVGDKVDLSINVEAQKDSK